MACPNIYNLRRIFAGRSEFANSTQDSAPAIPGQNVRLNARIRMQFGRPALSRHKYRLVFVTIRNPAFTLGVETDKTSVVGLFDGVPVYASNQTRLLNTSRRFLFSKQAFDVAWHERKNACLFGWASSTDSQPSKQQSLLQFPISKRVP